MEATIELLNKKIDIRDDFIERMIYDNVCLMEEVEELQEAGFELQKEVLDLKEEMLKLKQKSKKK